MKYVKPFSMNEEEETSTNIDPILKGYVVMTNENPVRVLASDEEDARGQILAKGLSPRQVFLEGDIKDLQSF